MRVQQAHPLLGFILILGAGIFSTSESAAQSRHRLGQFKVTYYWVAKEADYPGPKTTRISDRGGRSLGLFAARFVRALRLEGSAATRDGRVLNVDGKVGGSPRFRVLKPSQPYGIGSRENPLIPFRSVATDKRVIPCGTVLFIPQVKGARLPDGSLHDGYFMAADTGGGIKGAHLDLFTGIGDQRRVLTGAGVRNLGKTEVFIVKDGVDRPYLRRVGASAPRTPTPGPRSPRVTPRPPASTPPAAEPSKETGKVTAGSLNVRDGAGIRHRVVGSLKRGAEVKVLGRRGEWVKIDFHGQERWVHGRYLRVGAASRSAGIVGGLRGAR